MSPRSFAHTSKSKRNDRLVLRRAARLLRFEIFEDRSMLSFTPGVPIDAASIISSEVVTADFNGDGYLDAVKPSAPSNKVGVMLGNGQGGFGDVDLFDVGNDPVSIAVGDFNEDGKLDLATANMGDFTLSGPPSVSVLLGNGNGTFGTARSIPTAGSARSVAVGDFNADGNLDLGVSNSDGAYYTFPTVHHGDGAGNFVAGKLESVIDGIFELARAADLNGDGADDLVLADNSKSDGGFVAFFGGHPSGSLQLSNVLNYSLNVRDVAIGDVNNDGAMDLVTVNTAQDLGVWVFLGNGQGGFAPRKGYAVGYGAYSVVLGDFTGDGHLDICFDGLGISRGNGDGDFSVPERLAGGSASAAGDFNNDGRLDVISSNFDSFMVLLNDGEWLQLPGDYNLNGSVDAADYTVWRNSSGQNGLTPYSGADGSGDGSVGPDDYRVWKSNFHQSLPQTSAFARDAYVTEGHAGFTNAVFTVALSNAIDEHVTIHYQTEDLGVGPDYAQAGSDYLTASGNLVIPAGQTIATFTVKLLGDVQREADYERFGVRISVPPNVAVWNELGTIYITNDDAGSGSIANGLIEGGRMALVDVTDTRSVVTDRPNTAWYRNSAQTSERDETESLLSKIVLHVEPAKTVVIEVIADSNANVDDSIAEDASIYKFGRRISSMRGNGATWNNDIDALL